MWTVCITSIRHVLKLNGYGGPQAKANEKRLRFKGWETLVINYAQFIALISFPFISQPDCFLFVLSSTLTARIAFVIVAKACR